MKKILIIIVLLTSALLNNAQTIKCIPESDIIDEPAVRFAVNEMYTFLGKVADTSKKTIIPVFFKIDRSLHNGSFAFEISKKELSPKITLSGEGVTEIVHAAHSFLEYIGYQFELSGFHTPEILRLDTLKTVYKKIRPYTRWRGIRQHVNFPMDISSYPLNEAKEYLTRLIRMRFNEIAIHSYPNLWHEVYTGDSTEYAGNFFYNRPHEIPLISPFKETIRFNSRYFCIPEIEPFYENRSIKSRMSVDWMRELIAHAKNIGMKVHFSIEPRRRGDIDYIIDNCRSALINYPMIDELEINTEELGGWGNGCSDSMVKEVLLQWFGQETLKDTFILNRIQKQQTDLDNLLIQIGRNIEAVKRLRKDAWFRSKNVPLQLGIYCTITPYADIAYRLTRRFLPDTDVSIMPGHGSVRTADHFSKLHIRKQDLPKTTVFSWIEFDGLMFTLQNPIEGIASLFEHVDTLKGQQQLHGILFNHWRTAENAMGARYAAETSLFGPVPKHSFYIARAATFGCTDGEKFASAMDTLEKIDKISTNELPNYGFCWIGAWINGGPYNWIDTNRLLQVRKMYEHVQSKIRQLNLTRADSFGKEVMSFLQNRIETSIEYLSAFQSACKIQSLKKNNDGKYPAEEKAKAINMINEAFTAYENYMAGHALKMPDRGCEGTLINLWHGPIYGLKVMRERIAGVPVDIPFKTDGKSDSPPLPIHMKGKKETDL